MVDWTKDLTGRTRTGTPGALEAESGATYETSGSPTAENATTSATAVRIISAAGSPSAENGTTSAAASLSWAASGTPQSEVATASGIATRGAPYTQGVAYVTQSGDSPKERETAYVFSNSRRFYD